MKRNPFVYYGKKALIFIISVFVLSVAVFYISRLAPGDPLVSYYGERVEKMSVSEKDAARERLGLNDPIPSSMSGGFKTLRREISASPTNTSRMCSPLSASALETP